MDLEIEYYDLGLPNRDATDDKVTHDAAHAILVCHAFTPAFTAVIPMTHLSYTLLMRTGCKLPLDA